MALVVYDYNKNEEEKYKEIIRIEGKRNNEKRKCLDCEKCWYKENRIIKNIDVTEEILKACTEVNNE